MTPGEKAADILRRCWQEPRVDVFEGLDVEIEKAIVGAVAEEREACAQVADAFASMKADYSLESIGVAEGIAAEIRSRT